MKELSILLSKEKFNFKFKQYEGSIFNAFIDNETVKYNITKNSTIKEFWITHIKDDMLYIPQLDIYIDLKNI